jgi:hypothetical protein
MTFHIIAARVRSKTWDDDWLADLFLHLPDDLLHTFATDCAQRALELEKKRGRDAYASVWEVLKAKRRWNRGDAPDRVVDSAFDVAHRAIGYRELHARSATALETAIDAMLEAANHDPVDAVNGAAWAAARSFAIATKEASGAAERRWQMERLATLCEMWGNVGEDNAARLANASE